MGPCPALCFCGASTSDLGFNPSVFSSGSAYFDLYLHQITLFLLLFFFSEVDVIMEYFLDALLSPGSEVNPSVIRSAVPSGSDPKPPKPQPQQAAGELVDDDAARVTVSCLHKSVLGSFSLHPGST